MQLRNSGIVGCELVPVLANRDDRGCLFELFRESEALQAVQWNACASKAGVVRGAHVHVDYDEYYTLPRGRVVLGLADIRRNSPTYRKSTQIPWRDKDGFAVVIPRGVAHVLLFEEESVLVFGLSGYWQAKYDIVGCQWDDPELGLQWPARSVVRSDRDTKSGDYQAMSQLYEELSQDFMSTGAAHAPLHQI
jgi:dTDP-4-dehydrorhamnose 3,5-epimerase